MGGLPLFLDCYLDGNLTLYGVCALPEYLASDVENMYSVIGCYSAEIPLLNAKGFGEAIETHVLPFLKWEVLFILGSLSYVLDFDVKGIIRPFA